MDFSDGPQAALDAAANAKMYEGSFGKESDAINDMLHDSVGLGRKHFAAAAQLSDVDEVVFGRDLDGSGSTKALVTLPEFDGACGVASRPTDRRHLQRDAWRQMGEVRARHDADADAAAAVVAADAAIAAADAAVADAAAADGSVDFLGASAAARQTMSGSSTRRCVPRAATRSCAA